MDYQYGYEDDLYGHKNVEFDDDPFGGDGLDD